MEEILTMVGKTVTEEPVEITVTLSPRGRFHKLLQKWKLFPSKKVFLIHPLNLGTIIRISTLLAEIKIDVKKLLEDSRALPSKYGDALAHIIAIAVKNHRGKPSEYHQRIIRDNMTSGEIASLFGVVLQQMNIQGFINAIILTSGINALEMSQTEQGS